MQKREIIVKIIVQDIRHNMLLNGLQGIGLVDDERYTLNIDQIVAELMGKQPTDDWMNTYWQTMVKLQPNMTPKEQVSVANNLFESLCHLQ
ncbi:MAG: hypothetical protein WDZ35_07940 [Crocinitomicaceae bacterium]